MSVQTLIRRRLSTVSWDGVLIGYVMLIAAGSLAGLMATLFGSLPLGVKIALVMILSLYAVCYSVLSGLLVAAKLFDMRMAARRFRPIY